MAISLNAKTPYDPVLTGIGLLNGGKLSDAAKLAFVADVGLLLVKGNADGSTLVPIGSLFPLPPVGGPLVPNLNPFSPGLEPVFWFGPDPTAVLQIPALADPAKTPFWHSIFIDTLFQATATALDLPGNTPLFPMFDISAPFGIPSLPLPFSLPDLAVALNIQPLPKLLLKLAGLNIQLSIPSISIPTIPIPQLPQLPPLPKLPDFLLGMFELPFKLLLKLLVPPDVSLVFDLPNLPKAVFKVAFDLVLELLAGLGFDPFPLLPKAFVASMIVYLKNVIAMVCCVIIGNIVGTGAMAQGVGITLGLLK